jgi:hypothetical protein
MKNEAMQINIQNLSLEQKEIIFKELRKEIPIHRLEEQWNITAEFVLEAISRSQDITKRGVRGIIAELCFSHYIMEPLAADKEWSVVELDGSLSYDFLIKNKAGRELGIQVKNQRVVKGNPLYATVASKKKFEKFPEWWVAECQRTRNGTDSTGQKTRPYKFGEFDILAVCLHPSTTDWKQFMFIEGNKLFPRKDDKNLIDIMQPVSPYQQGDWYDNIVDCINSIK